MLRESWEEGLCSHNFLLVTFIGPLSSGILETNMVLSGMPAMVLWEYQQKKTLRNKNKRTSWSVQLAQVFAESNYD